MLHSRDFSHLTYQGEPYINKLPLFFWTLAFFTSVFGEHEVSLRLPAALSSLGTMALVYLLGKQLFSRTAGFWAALLVATTYVSLWYGRRVLFDASITFFVTLAVYAWARSALLKGSSWWYLLSFLAMALGSMIKGLHAFALPFLLILVYSAFQRDLRRFTQPLFFGGLLLFVLLIGLYASLVGGEFHVHFNVLHRLERELLERDLDSGNQEPRQGDA